MSASKQRIARQEKRGGILDVIPQDARIKTGPHKTADGSLFVELTDGRLARWRVMGYVWDGKAMTLTAVRG